MKRSSKAAKDWSGTFAELHPKKEKLAAKLQQGLAQPEAADTEAEESSGAGRCLAQAKEQEQLKRLERQAARIEAFLATNDPKRGKPSQEGQSNGTDNESAKLQTASGVLQGYNSQALVDAQPQVIVQAEAFGKGQDSGHGKPRREGAKENMQALGLGEEYCVGKILSADSNYHSAENLQTCAQEKLDAYIPDNQCRQRDPRFAAPEPHEPPTDEKLTVAEFTYDPAQEGYRCPAGKRLKLKARRHQIKHILYSRYEATEADCRGCALREQWLQSPETRRKHLAVFLERGKRHCPSR